MANCSAYARQLCLDWLLTTNSATRPTVWYLGLGTNSAPTSVSGYEVPVTNGYARRPVTFNAATSPGGTTNPTGAVSFSAATYASTLRCWQIWDDASSGNMLWYGTLSAATRPTSLSGFTFNSVSIKLSCL